VHAHRLPGPQTLRDGGQEHPKVREEVAAATAIGGNVRAEMLLMAPAVRRGAEGGRRHPGGDLLRRQDETATFHR
jgi:hypothetical protein